MKVSRKSWHYKFMYKIYDSESFNKLSTNGYIGILIFAMIGLILASPFLLLGYIASWLMHYYYKERPSIELVD